MTTNPKRPRHPGQDDRRDTRKVRIKTDPTAIAATTIQTISRRSVTIRAMRSLGRMKDSNWEIGPSARWGWPQK